MDDTAIEVVRQLQRMGLIVRRVEGSVIVVEIPELH